MVNRRRRFSVPSVLRHGCRNPDAAWSKLSGLSLWMPKSPGAGRDRPLRVGTNYRDVAKKPRDAQLSQPTRAYSSTCSNSLPISFLAAAAASCSTVNGSTAPLLSRPAGRAHLGSLQRFPLFSALLQKPILASFRKTPMFCSF